MRIIDIHTHPVFFEAGASKPEVAELVRYSRTLGIEKMVSLGDVLRYGPSPNAEQLRFINEQTKQLMDWYPDFFVGFCHLNPTLGEKALRAELERCIEDGFRGIKLEIANNASNPVMKPLMKAAEQFKLTVLQHTWDCLGTERRSFESDPRDTCLLAKRFPNATIIMAHLYGIGIRGVLEAQDLPNLFVDTSSCLPSAGFLEYAVEKLGPDRILYGSDLPIRELGQCIGRITGSDIEEESKKHILFTNAQKLLQLS